MRGRDGGTEKIILFMFYGGGGGNEDFVDIWGGGSRIGLVLGVISMQFGPSLKFTVQNTKWRYFGGCSNFSFIYLSIYF